MNPLEGIGVLAIVSAAIVAVAGVGKLVSMVLEMDRHQKMCDAHFREHCTWAHDRTLQLSCRIATIEEAFKKSADNAAEQLKGL
mgnify:CR=1 FL=1